MKFTTEIVPWINEIKSYLNGNSNKIGQLKKILREVDFEQLDYATKAKLTNLFDPRCEITEEVFKRELNLYFSLLEDKKPINIPIFSEFIEWIYNQDISKMPDRTFELISSRLSKTTAEMLPEKISSFMSRLPEEYKKGIDQMSNARMATLINILNDTKMNFADMPEECKGFVREMFNACAVKTEISENNKNKFRGIFREDPRYYYSILNKAFARVDEFDTWIDEPAKKITYARMVDYANFQNKVLDNLDYGLSYSKFDSYARNLGLYRFPEIDGSSYSKKFYLSEPREYKDYAKKMGNLFVEMVQCDIAEIREKLANKTFAQEDAFDFAVTDKMKRELKNAMDYGFTEDGAFLNFYSDFLVDLVHLDELTGQSRNNIFENKQPKIEHKVETKTNNNKTITSAPVYEKADDYQFTHNLSLHERILNRCCLFDDLPLLYEMFEKAKAKGQSTYDLEQAIFDLECRIHENEIDESFDKD